MAKTEPKPRPTDAVVEEFLNGIADDARRTDAFALLEIFKRVTGEEPVMWGTAIIGFGSRNLKYASGRELDWPVTGFSPRKSNLALYVGTRSPNYPEFLSRLGKHKTGVSCLYLKRLSDADASVLEDVIRDAVEYTDRHPGDAC